MQYFVASLLMLLGLANSLQCTEANGGHNTLGHRRVKLEVHPHMAEGPHTGVHRNKVFLVDKKIESMNMTCTVVRLNPDKGEDVFFDYDVDWKPPRHVTNNPKIETGQSRNMAWIWFEHLSTNDSGEYSCHAVPQKSLDHQSTLGVTFHLFVERKSTFCGPKWFKCRSKICINQRFVCDGKQDCEEGEDESPAAGCGPNPCLGKILCEGRCMPADWCCDHGNCSGTFEFRPWPHENHEISYVQTAFYTVIGCAMAFMFIVTILVIAICRVQIKRAMNSRCSIRGFQQNRRVCTRRAMPLYYDLDVYLNRTAGVNYPGGVSIMYNINSGVQFVGRPAEPPPYSAVVAEPPRDGPPPPYASCENLIVRQLNPRFAEGSEPSNVADAVPVALEIEQSGAEENANPPDTDIRITAQSNIGHDGQRDSSVPNVPGPQVANHACVPQPRHVDDRDVFTTWVGLNAVRPRETTDTPPSSLENARGRVQPPPNFELEYVETDALLTENLNNPRVVQNTKGIVWKPYTRHSLAKSQWLSNAKNNDKIPEKHWYRQRVEKTLQDDRSTRTRDISTARELENEGNFLDTDQQDSTPAESTTSGESEIAANFPPFVNIVETPKVTDKSDEAVATPGCSKAANADAPSSSFAQDRRDLESAEHSATLKKHKSDTKAARKEKCKSEVISDGIDETPTDKNFLQAIRRKSSLTSEEIRSKNIAESSASASAGNVSATSSRIGDTEESTQIREVSNLVLPLRESFIGVQRDS